ncbi:MAG: glycosyltransferase [Candidatus Bathyarchaeia archaeon]
MKMLFIASRFPYPLIQGDRVRAYHFLRLLSLRHEITLVTPISYSVDSGFQEVIPHICKRWIEVPFRQQEAIMNLLSFPFSGLPMQVLYFCPPAIQRTFQELIREESYELLHVQLARMAPVAESVTGVPKVIDFIDALSLNMYRRAKREQWPLNWVFHLETQRMVRYERRLISFFDQQVVSSPLDKKAMGDFETIHVIPNGVNLSDFPYNESGRDDGLIVFTGRMGYFPNAEAAIHFTTRIFPLIRKQVPDARFLIVGADPPRRVRSLAKLPGIEVTGYVPRIQDYLARATVAVAPMQAGTGIQNKLLEAMASGVPVVATPYALGGIEVIDGEHLLVAEDDKEFAEKVVRLLKDRALRCRLARNARRLVEEKYTWERSVEMLEEVYQRAIERKVAR